MHNVIVNLAMSRQLQLAGYGSNCTTYSWTVPSILIFTFTLKWWNMLLLMTNNERQTPDVFNKTFASVEVTRFQNAYSGIVVAPTLYKTCEKRVLAHSSNYFTPGRCQMKVPVIDDFSVLIGIDWADKKHDVCEQPVGATEMHFTVISSKPEALHEWAVSLKERYPHKPVAIACELKKGPLIYALSKYAHITLFTINPATVARYRTAFTQSGAKDDPNDARIQTEIMALHMDKLDVVKPESAPIRALAQLLEYRRKLVQDRVDCTNRITAILKNYYSQVRILWNLSHAKLNRSLYNGRYFRQLHF